MTGIIVDWVRLGTVACFAGNKPPEKWVAWSIHRKSAVAENSARFSNMHAAIDWLRVEHDRVASASA